MSDEKIKAYRVPMRWTWKDLFKLMEKHDLLDKRVEVCYPYAGDYDNECYICDNGDLLVNIDGAAYEAVLEDMVDDRCGWDDDDFERRVKAKTEEYREVIRERYAKWLPLVP